MPYSAGVGEAKPLASRDAMTRGGDRFLLAMHEEAFDGHAHHLPLRLLYLGQDLVQPLRPIRRRSQGRRRSCIGRARGKLQAPVEVAHSQLIEIASQNPVPALCPFDEAALT